MIFGDLKDPPQSKRAQYKTTTVRRFDGGWNVIDHELNLTPRHARIFDNVVRGPDGSVATRYGYKLWADLHQGEETSRHYTGSVSTTQIGTRNIQFNITGGHGLQNGDHITFGTVSGTVGGIDLSALSNTANSVRLVTATSFAITVKTVATSLASTTVDINVVTDTHLGGGRTINGIAYNNYIVVATEAGELIRITNNAGMEKIWDNPTAFQLGGNPQGWYVTTFVSFTVFGGKLLAWNGVDKPVEVDFTRAPIVQFLADPAAGGSNASVPIGRYSAVVNEYVLNSGKTDRPAELSISAHLIAGVWTGNADDEDAVDVDMSKVSNSMDGVIMGVGEFRTKAVVAFRDAVTIGTLGIRTSITVGSVTSDVHEPEFKDTVAQHGTISHRTMVNLGNDFLMCDHVGVPSLAQTQLTDQIVPDRVSELIEPALQINLSRLTRETLRDNAFAVYNSRDHQYMLFMPKYDSTDIRGLRPDPILIDEEVGTDRFVVTVTDHGLEEGDLVKITGVLDIGPNPADSFNGSRRVLAVVDKDRVVVQGTGAYIGDYIGGGNSITIQPISEETLGYIFAYNPKLKIKAWSRFTGLNFDWGARSVQGRLFFGKGGKVHEFGTPEFPIYADDVGVYDYKAWQYNKAYAVGNRVPDGATVYVALIAHTSGNAGSFAQERISFPERWEVYTGKPIRFVWEWPWGDFDKRMNTKAMRAIQLDAAGIAEFRTQVFVDNIYKDSLTGLRTPARTIAFVGADTGGYGAGTQPFGGGRRLREQPYWAYPIIGKLHKIRFEGEIKEPLRFIAVSIAYHEGSLKR
jgi:hypothetical protein